MEAGKLTVCNFLQLCANAAGISLTELGTVIETSSLQWKIASDLIPVIEEGIVRSLFSLQDI